jgi:hypothetical protein
MRNQLYTVLFVALLGCLGITVRAQTPGADFTLRVIQDGKEIDQQNGVCLLQRAPFTLVFEMTSNMPVLVNASFRELSLEAARRGTALNSIPGFRETGMAEGILNEDQDVMVNDAAPSYWYYDSPADHRYDSVVVRNGHYWCYRTIKKVYDVPTEQSTPLRKITTPLNLVCVTYDQAEGDDVMIERQRTWLQLRWAKP